MKHQVVRCDAGLPGVETLAPGYALRGHLDVGVLVHDARALPAEFQHDRRKVLRRRSHHDPSERRASGEEDQIPAFLQQGRVDLAVALDDGDIFIAESVFDHLLCYFGDVRDIRRRLQDRRAAGGNRSNQRSEKQLHRVVPRRDDQSCAQRLADDPAPRREHLQRSRLPLRPAPFPNVMNMPAYLSQKYADLSKISLLI